MTCLSSPNSFHHIKEAPIWYNNIYLQLKELQGSEPKERVSREIQRQQRRQKQRHSGNFRVSWNSSTLATSCEELTHWKRLWCWEGLGAGGEGDDRGWDGWMASLTRWMWVWVNSGSWWWTGRPGVLQFMGSQRVGHDWVTDLIWSYLMVNMLRDLIGKVYHM